MRAVNTACSIVPDGAVDPHFRPSRKRTHTAQYPQRSAERPNVVRKTSIRNSVPSHSNGSECTGVLRLMAHLNRVLKGRTIVRLEKSAGKGFSHVRIVLDNGDWVIFDAGRLGTVKRQLFVITPWMLRNAARVVKWSKNGFCQT